MKMGGIGYCVIMDRKFSRGQSVSFFTEKSTERA